MNYNRKMQKVHILIMLLSISEIENTWNWEQGLTSNNSKQV